MENFNESNCCFAPIVNGLCSKCHEHCDVAEPLLEKEVVTELD